MNVLQCATQPFLLPDCKRRDIEYDILSIVLDMAVKGRRAFRPKMKAAILGWKAQGILDDTNTCVFTDESPKASLMDWSTEFKAVDQVKRYWIEKLSKEIRKVKPRSVAGQSIDMTSLEVEWAVDQPATMNEKDSPDANARGNADGKDDGTDKQGRPKRKRDGSEKGDVEGNRKPKKKRGTKVVLRPIPIKHVYKLPSVWDTKKCKVRETKPSFSNTPNIGSTNRKALQRVYPLLSVAR